VVGIVTEIDLLRHVMAVSETQDRPELDVVVSHP